jgi:hypothetical protein
MKKPISLRAIVHKSGAEPHVSLHCFNIKKDGEVGCQLSLLGDVPLADWVAFIQRAQDEIRIFGLDGAEPASLCEQLLWEQKRRDEVKSR